MHMASCWKSRTTNGGFHPAWKINYTWGDISVPRLMTGGPFPTAWFVNRLFQNHRNFALDKLVMLPNATSSIFLGFTSVSGAFLEEPLTSEYPKFHHPICFLTWNHPMFSKDLNLRYPHVIYIYIYLYIQYKIWYCTVVLFFGNDLIFIMIS